jgi:5-hydroxyisourate hydrolase-like protein (transthyretin family)
MKVGLQRLVGRHWRTVSEGTIRRNGRFTLVATPPKGRNLYRVAFPTQQTFASATSRTFTIRGT